MVKGELQSALADRYTIERELGRGGMGTTSGQLRSSETATARCSPAGKC
jgi:hypothetical protein